MEPASRITQSRLDCQSQGRLSQLAISDVLGPVGLAFFFRPSSIIGTTVYNLFKRNPNFN